METAGERTSCSLKLRLDVDTGLRHNCGRSFDFHEFESRHLQKRGGPLTSEFSDRHVCKCYILQSFFAISSAWRLGDVEIHGIPCKRVGPSLTTHKQCRGHCGMQEGFASFYPGFDIITSCRIAFHGFAGRIHC